MKKIFAETVASLISRFFAVSATLDLHEVAQPSGAGLDFLQALDDGTRFFCEEGAEPVLARTTFHRTLLFLANMEAYGLHWDHTFARVESQGYAEGDFRYEPVTCGAELVELGLHAGLFPTGGSLGAFAAVEGYLVVRRAGSSIPQALITVRKYGQRWGVAFPDGQEPAADLAAWLADLQRARVLAELHVSQPARLLGGQAREIDLRLLAFKLARELSEAFEEDQRREEELAALEARFFQDEAASW